MRSSVATKLAPRLDCAPSSSDWIKVVLLPTARRPPTEAIPEGVEAVPDARFRRTTPTFDIRETFRPSGADKGSTRCDVKRLGWPSSWPWEFR